MVELVLYQPGLHPRPLLLDVDLDDLVHVAREVEDKGAVDRLAGERGAAAARQQRDLLIARDLHRSANVVGIARDDDANRLDLVHGGVGRVEELGALIEPDITADDATQRTLEVVHAAIITGGDETLSVTEPTT